MNMLDLTMRDHPKGDIILSTLEWSCIIRSRMFREEKYLPLPTGEFEVLKTLLDELENIEKSL